MAFARVGGRNDDADGFLIEALKAATALEVLEMAAQRAFADELLNVTISLTPFTSWPEVDANPTQAAADE